MKTRLSFLMLATIWCVGCGGSSNNQKAAILGWVLGKGGVIHIQDQTLEVKKLADLPTGNFEVAKIDLTMAPITDAEMENLAQLPELTALTLHGTKISDEGLAQLTSLKNLKELDLTNTNISDEGLKTLSEIKSLEKLHLHNTAVTNEGLKDFHAAVPDCQLFPVKR